MVGERALTVEFANRIDLETNRSVLSLAERLKKEKLRGLEEMVPAYRSLLVIYDPSIITFKPLERIIKAALKKSLYHEPPASKLFKIPVCYGNSYGPDLPDVALHCKMPAEEVILKHSENPYRIYMLGFVPGFCYLGGMNPALNTPRLKNPRTQIPPGSVGIAGEQTGIYPVNSPGGWRLIGRTPLRLFNPGSDQPFLFQAGDSLSFVPIDEEEYKLLQAEVADGRFRFEAEAVL